MNSNILHSHAAEIGREIQNHRYEVAPEGVLLPRMGVFIGGSMLVRDYRDGSVEQMTIDANTLVREGLIHICNQLLPPTGGYTGAIQQWYIVPFEGNYAPDGNTLTAANFPATANEFEAYTATQRPALVIANAATTPSTGNTGNEAVLTMAAGGPHNIYGAALTSSSAKGSTTGKLLACVRFDNPRLNLAPNDKLGLEYVFTAADAA